MNQWWVKEFCKGNKSLEDEERRGWPQEVDKDQLRDIIKDDPLTTAEVDEELNVDHSTVFWHLKQIGKVKKFDKWVPHELTKIKKKKNCHSEILSSLILGNSSEPFLDQIVIHNEKCILYNNLERSAQWVGWKEAPKHFPKPNLH